MMVDEPTADGSLVERDFQQLILASNSSVCCGLQTSTSNKQIQQGGYRSILLDLFVANLGNHLVGSNSQPGWFLAMNAY